MINLWMNLCQIIWKLFNADLAITGTITGTSHEKLYQGLWLEYLHTKKRWMKGLCLLNKVISPAIHSCTYSSFLQWDNPRDIQISPNSFSYRTESFKQSFFLRLLVNRTNVILRFVASDSYNIFHKSLLNFRQNPKNKLNPTLFLKYWNRMYLT